MRRKTSLKIITEEQIKEISDEARKLYNDYPELTVIDTLRIAKEMIIDESIKKNEEINQGYFA